MAMPQLRRSGLLKLARLWLFSAGLLMAASPTAPAATPEMSPSAVVQHFYAALLDTMQHAAALGAKGRYEKLQPFIFGTFDLPFMARLTIGPLWFRLPPEQKYQATQAYGRYITAIYADRFDGYSGERLEVLGEQKISHGMLFDRKSSNRTARR
jgi:phospholipid transport system substrate-binding protein